MGWRGGGGGVQSLFFDEPRCLLYPEPSSIWTTDIHTLQLHTLIEILFYFYKKKTRETGPVGSKKKMIPYVVPHVLKRHLEAMSKTGKQKRHSPLSIFSLSSHFPSVPGCSKSAKKISRPGFRVNLIIRKPGIEPGTFCAIHILLYSVKQTS